MSVHRSTTPKQPQVIVVAPGPYATSARQLAGSIRAAASQAGLSTIVRLAPRIGVDRQWQKGSVPVLRPPDAHEIYRRLHHGPVAVVALAQVWVARDPRLMLLTEENAISLERYVAYKAYYAFATHQTIASDLITAFAQWRSVTRCDGPNDPRVLPLHSFDAPVEPGDLSDVGRRRQFNSEVGSQRRRSLSGLKWNRAAPHGQEHCQIAGLTLPMGTHWDVEPDGRGGTIINSHGVWRIPHRGYANVSPNADVRQGRRNTPSIKRIWPDEKGARVRMRR